MAAVVVRARVVIVFENIVVVAPICMFDFHFWPQFRLVFLLRGPERCLRSGGCVLPA